MQVENRYHALNQEHQRIEASLAAEMKRPLPDAFVVQRLKKRKLLVKDKIASSRRDTPVTPLN